MKIVGNMLQRTFLVTYKGKRYYVDYINADYPALSLLNRNNWEIKDEDGEDLQIYELKFKNKKKSRRIRENRKKFNKIIKFCVKHFDSYNFGL